MRRALIALAVGALATAACGRSAPHVYPETARAEFDRSCPPDNAVCGCTWDEITRALPHDEYEAALSRFDETGNMDPRITRARATCLERAAR
jgi:hypothetical protein